MKKSLIKALQDKDLLLLDGGMGSMLAAKGLSLDAASHNLYHPDAVEAVHREYIAAGADIILTNTLTLNDIYQLGKEGYERIDEANAAAASIAQRAAGDDKYVLGDIGPTGQMLKPLGDGDPDEFFAAYLRQAQVLAQNGVDGFLIETVFALDEALIALKACKSVSDLPVLVSLTFSTVKKGGRTVMGNSAAQCAQSVLVGGGAAVGANCGDLTPDELAVVAANMLPFGLPVSIEPNAGKPQIVDGQTVYDMTPDAFADGTFACYQAGATLLGGCCGTTPAHIKALKARLKEA